MTARQHSLPERPNLEQLKRQAKDLLRAARAHDRAALARFRVLPNFTALSDDRLAATPLALHDAQSVVARELGFDSWNALRESVEEATLTFGAAVTEFVDAATSGRPDRAARLLELHPGMASADFHAALLLGDSARVEEWLRRDPSRAIKPGGVRGWQPLHYLCHSVVGARTPEGEAGLATIARRLIALGADPNLRFPWLHHDVARPVLWGAVCHVRSLALARALLEGGADPNDGVTLTIAASGGDIPALDLLYEFGANANGVWLTDGSTALYAILHWSQTPAGAFWFLEHGADANAVFAPNGETPLHAAAAGWGTDLVSALLAHGADVSIRRADGRTAYALAIANGNDAVAELLLAHGSPADVPEVDRLVGACSRGDVAAARAMLASTPALRDEIAIEHYDALYRAAEQNDVAALEAMLACGFDPDRGDAAMGMNALHKAAMAGWPDAVRVLLAHGASVTARDREFHATALVAAAEGSTHAAPGRDHAAVGRLLIAAGSPTDWEAGAQPAGHVLDVLERWLRAP
ncbi:MAG TPA: ankyrin repeat domain-containing protein [Gemmatimonadaceae bacterium]|nr:ankyrin repeat domain-containing protein [Gemmatimonadaceae bacterium]